jgi:2-oxoglutarate ferredoxin oxidoreductase subunit alpha
MEKGSKGIDPNTFWQALSEKEDRIAEKEKRWDSEGADDAELLVVAFGTVARFARSAIKDLRAEGLKVGLFRPITLWPFPSEALAEAANGCTRIACLEQNAGQMIDDVRLSVLGTAPVVPIGGISTDAAGFGIGALLDSDLIRERIRMAYEGRDVPKGVVA